MFTITQYSERTDAFLLYRVELHIIGKLRIIYIEFQSWAFHNIFVKFICTFVFKTMKQRALNFTTNIAECLALLNLVI